MSVQRTVGAYALAVVVAYGAAYLAWTTEDEQDVAADSVVVVPGNLAGLEKVVYANDERELVIRPKKDELGEYLWVEETPLETDETNETEPVGPQPPEGNDEQNEDHEPSAYKAGLGGENALDAVTPFVVERKLEGLTDDQLPELGLDDPSATLVIKRKGKEPRSFDMGSKVFGGAELYLRDQSDGSIYVVRASSFGSLNGGKASLLDPRLTGLTEPDMTAIEVRTPQETVRYVQRNPDDSQARYWGLPDEDEPVPEAEAWLDKFLRMRVTEYVDEVPTGLEEAYVVTIPNRKGPAVVAQVFRLLDASGEETWYAKSNYTRSMVKLIPSMASETMNDLSSLFGEPA